MHAVDIFSCASVSAYVECLRLREDPVEVQFKNAIQNSLSKTNDFLKNDKFI